MSATAVKLNKKGQPDLRSAKRAGHLGELEALLRKPRSIDECAQSLGVTARAVYFLFAALEERGQTVARLGSKTEGRYLLMRA